MAIKEFKTDLQLIKDSSGNTHPWYMSGKASIDDSGNIITETHLESHASLMGFTGGMYVEFIDANGNQLFKSPLLQYGVDGPGIPAFFGATPSPRTASETFKVDPSVYAKVDKCTIQLLHAGKNRLNENIQKFFPYIYYFIELLRKTGSIDLATAGRNDISTLQSALSANEPTVYALHDGGNTKGEIIATWNYNRSSQLTTLPKNEPVTVFEHDNYGGRSQIFEVGHYDMNQITIGNDVISSIRVKDGYIATLFKDAGFKGEKHIYTNNMSSLPNFNDATSSIVVEEGVCVYEHDNYGGRFQTLPVGAYLLQQLFFINFDNIISSVKVPNGFKVTLYADLFSGAKKELRANTPSLPDFNDITSSIIVERLP